jgi:polar amino acid transport system permease protein
MDYLTGIAIAAHGIGMTLYVSLLAILLGIAIGLIMALARLSKNIILQVISNVYIEVVRGTPLFVQILIFAYGVPYLISSLSGGSVRFNWEPIVIVGVLACGLNSGAYLAEIIRSGIQAVDKGQVEASRSLGLSGTQTMTNIVLPQAFRIILPAMGNEFVTLIKETSILSYIGIVEITREGMLWAARDFKSFPAYIGVALVYMCLTIPLSRLVAYMEKRMSPDKKAKIPKRRKPGM